MKSQNVSDLPLFMQIKNRIYEQILDSKYNPGEKIPTEAVWAKDFAVSRVTVRKALDELKKEGVISSVQGQGTVVTFDQNVSKDRMDTIAVIAGAHDQFLGSFLDVFDREANQNDALVVYKSDPYLYEEDGTATFKTLYKRNIRNCVLWPNQGFDDEDLLYRLRLLGMNLVFFDHTCNSSHADSVTLDNKHAVESLYEYATQKGCSRINFLGWRNVPLSSTAERISAFKSLSKNPETVKLFEQGVNLEEDVAGYLESPGSNIPEVFLCGNGDLAVALKKVLSRKTEISPMVLSIDAFPQQIFPEVTCYEQPLAEMATEAFKCLQKQNDSKINWKAKTYRIKGRVV